MLWRPFLTTRADAEYECVDIESRPWGYTVLSHVLEVNMEDPWRALIESRNAVIKLVFDRSPDVLKLHAAVVVREGKALLLLGDSWAGKTTLALRLTEEGWQYFSDDAAVFDTGSTAVRPFPKPPGVKAYSWDQMSHHWTSLADHFDPPDAAFLIPPPFTGSLDEEAEPRWLVFLEYDPSEPGRLEAVPQGAATAKVAGHADRVDGATLSRIAQLARGCSSYRLAYGSTEQAVRQLGLVKGCGG